MTQSTNQTDTCDPVARQITQIKQALAKGNDNLAQQGCEKILRQHYHSDALLILVNIARKYHHFEQAALFLQQGLKQDANNPALWYTMVKVLADKCSYSKAITAGKILVKKQPQQTENWLLLISVLTLAGQTQSALVICQSALEITNKPSYQSLRLTLQLGHLYKAIGKRQDAENCYQACLQHPELRGDGYWALANLKTYDFSPVELQSMQQCVQENQLNQQQHCALCFALGKAYEDTAQYPRAFDYYLQANNSKPNVHFDPQHLDDKYHAIVDQYSQPSLTIQCDSNNQYSIPIFIIGLPRSGSTLLEQMLANHSQIEATAELMVLPNVVRRLQLRAQHQNISETELIHQLTPRELAAFGQAYLHETEIYRQNKDYFIDKLPANFQYVGLIQKILPQAIIIDIRRHPMACGFSNFKQNYAAGQNFSYKLQHIVSYYRYYLKLMNYWQTTLPGKVYTLDFDSLIKTPEQELTQLLNHYGFAFEEQCLTFYQQTSTISTSSSEQVRQPINQLVNQDWQHFSDQLMGFRTELGDMLLHWSGNVEYMATEKIRNHDTN
jgi:tetratricopeptide (TPR) repeat protein